MRFPFRFGRQAARSQAMDNAASAVRRSRLLDALHVFVLASFAISQPVYDRLGERASFLVDSHVTRSAVFLVILLLSVTFPGLLVLAERCAAYFGRNLYEALHGIIVFVLLVLVALPFFKQFDALLRAEIVFGLALTSGVVGVWSYFKSRHARAVVTCAAPGILLFPGVLVFGSSVTAMLLTPKPVGIDHWKSVPVVMVVFDEFCGTSLMTTDRQIDADRFPNFARLSSQSTWYRNATTVSGETRQALPAILSGQYPATKMLWPPLPAELPQNLFTILESTGEYELAVFEPVSNLATDRHPSADDPRPGLGKQITHTLDALGRVFLFHLIPSDFGKQLPKITPLWLGIRNSAKVDQHARRGVFRYAWEGKRSDQWRHFLRCLEPKVDSTLYFLHVVIPHVNWCYLPSGRRYATDDDMVDLMSLHAHNDLLGYFESDELFAEQQQLRYLLQLQYVDRLIGELMSRLRETGLYDRCLLIVVGDHGVSFRANQPRRNLSDANQADILSIPLFIKRPAQTDGGISDRCVESVDILPTIADVLEIKLRQPIEGRSVFDESLPGHVGKTFCQFDARSLSIERFAFDAEIVAKSDFPHLTRRRFGDPRNPTDLFCVGPIPELIGRHVDNLSMSNATAVDLELLRYGDVYDEASESIVPCFFEGLVRSPIEEDRPQTLAVAVNGTIRAVTRTYRLNGLRNRWAALVPESSFHPGRNDVRFFAVAGSGSDWQLSLCAMSRAEE